MKSKARQRRDQNARVRSLLEDPKTSGLSNKQLMAMTGCSINQVRGMRAALRDMQKHAANSTKRRWRIDARDPRSSYQKELVRAEAEVKKPTVQLPPNRQSFKTWGSVYLLMDGARELYVGATVQSLPRRLEQHIADAQSGKQSWTLEHIRAMLASGRRPTIEMLQTNIPVEMLGGFETAVIRRLWANGSFILNSYDTGYDHLNNGRAATKGTSKEDYLRSQLLSGSL